MTLSILIPTITGRESHYDSLIASIGSQYKGNEIEIITAKDSREKSIGQKRNELVQSAMGEYCVFVDDDDKLPPYYIEEILNASKSNPDAIGFKGNYYHDNVLKKEFVHSIKHKEYAETMYYFYRPPNHLNPIKTSIAKQFKFPHKSMFEDTDWAMQIAKSGLLKTEVFIDKIMYNYYYVSKKNY